MTISAESIGRSAAEDGYGEAGASTDAVRPLTVEKVAGETWDNTIAGFEGVCQEQLYIFAVNHWPGVECEPILFIENGEVVGGVLVMVQPLPLGLGSLAISKWGPIFKSNGRPDYEAVYAGAIEALVAEYAERRGMMISALPRARWTPRNVEADYLERRGFKPASRLPFPDRYAIKLRLSDEEQRKSFAQKWRYHLKKSEKAGLTFERGEPDRIGEFDALYQAMTDRKRFADHSAYTDTIHALMAIDNDALRPELFFVRHEGEIIAGAVIFKAGDTAVYLYGATNDKALPLRAGYFLHWHIIRWLRDNTSAEWYDLGGTDGFQGLHQFKKGMVGSEGRISPVPPVMNFAANARARIMGTLAFRGRDWLQLVRHRIETLRSDLANPDQRR